MSPLVLTIPFAIAGLPVCTAAQHTADRRAPPANRGAFSRLPGTWRVVRHEIRDTAGRLVSSDGGQRIGYVTFDASGHFTQLTMDAGRRVPAYRGRLTAEDARDAYETFGASFGTYTVRGRDTLAYRHEGALYPGNVPGTVVLRRYRIAGDTLITDPLGEEPGRPMFTRIHVRVAAPPVEPAADTSPSTGPAVGSCGVGAPARVLERMEAERAGILLRGDVASLDTLIDDAFVERLASGELRTKADNIAAQRTGALRFTAVEIDDVRASTCGESGLVTGRMYRRGVLQGRPFDGTVRYSRLFLRRGGRWKAVFQTGTPIAYDAADSR